MSKSEYQCPEGLDDTNWTKLVFDLSARASRDYCGEVTVSPEEARHALKAFHALDDRPRLDAKVRRLEAEIESLKEEHERDLASACSLGVDFRDECKKLKADRERDAEEIRRIKDELHLANAERTRLEGVIEANRPKPEPDHVYVPWVVRPKAQPEPKEPEIVRDIRRAATKGYPLSFAVADLNRLLALIDREPEPGAGPRTHE